jgi:hypothetical protein
MSDAGEGLVDAEARLQEQMDAREHEKRRRTAGKVADPEKHRANENLRLARADLAAQLELTTNPTRRKSIGAAIEEIDRRLASA